MSKIRPILPRPHPSDDSELYDADDGAPGASRPNRRRVERIAQACEVCRRKKIKCDGLRPVCSPCALRHVSCEYVNSTGQSKLDVANTRLKAYGALFDSLKNGTSLQGDVLLQQIRSADDVLSLVQLEITDNTAPRDDTVHDSVEMTNFERREINRLRNYHSDRNVAATSSQYTNPQTTQNPCLYHIELPSMEVTRAAVDFFFESSSRLFHVFSPPVLDLCLANIYENPEVTMAEKTIAIASVAATAAVGCQYSNGEFDEATERNLYSAARHCLDSVVENSPLDAIGVCSLLAMYNVMGKGTVALTYIEMGLSMSRRHGLFEKRCPYADMSHAKWLEHRRTWRALIFFSSWLGATLGYVSANDTLSDVKMSEMNVDESKDIEDIVQAELTKIALLKVTVLRLHLTFKDLTELTAESLLNDLWAWEAQLPEPLQLANINSGNLSIGLRRTTYYAHLLHLGAVVLVYRIIAYKTQRPPLLGPHIEYSTPPRIHRFAGHGIAAAQRSASILGDLLADEGVFRRCWLIMSQSYITCLTLMHSVVQGQLHRTPRAQWAENLRLARICISVLEHCGQMDHVAFKLHDELVNWYTKASDYAGEEVRDGSMATAVAHSVQPGLESGAYLLHIPAEDDTGRSTLAKELLRVVCAPFGDPNVMEHSEKLARTPGWHPDPTSYEHPRLIELLDYEPGKEARLYDTGVRVLMPQGGDNARPDPTHFLGNPTPHGWSLNGFPATYAVPSCASGS